MSSSISKNTWLQKWYFQKTEMDKLLIISTLFSLILVAIRIILTGKWLFASLSWNLFLAYIPYFISSRLERNAEWKESKWKLALVFAAWILFIPNSFYILTDLFHLKLREESHRWFDLTLIFSFAWNGLLLGILSVRQMEKIVVQSCHISNEFFFLVPVMWLNALGVYIGRYMRFNSWDVITNPFELSQDILYMLIHPFRNFSAWGMIGCFAVFMTIIYISVKRMARVI